MAVITSYSTLLTAVQNYINRTDLSTFAPNFVQNWEERFYRDPKNFGAWMENRFDTQLVDGMLAISTLSAVGAYLGVKYAYVDTSPAQRLDRVSVNQLFGTYPRNGDTGLPVWFAREATHLVFGPRPDSAYGVHLLVWNKPTALRSFASDADAHWIILNAPDLALYGALLEAEAFIRDDPRVPLWKSAYDLALTAYRNLFREEDLSGSPVQEVLA